MLTSPLYWAGKAAVQGGNTRSSYFNFIPETSNSVGTPVTSGVWKSPHSLLTYRWTGRHLHLQGTACTSERPRFQLGSEAWQERVLTAFYYCCIRGHYLHTINQQEVQNHLHITCRKSLPAGLKFLFCIIWSILAGRRCAGKNWNSIHLLFFSPTLARRKVTDKTRRDE